MTSINLALRRIKAKAGRTGASARTRAAPVSLPPASSTSHAQAFRARTARWMGLGATRAIASSVEVPTSSSDGSFAEVSHSSALSSSISLSALGFDSLRSISPL